MSPLKWQLLWHFANGDAFFFGTALILAAVMLQAILKSTRGNLIVYPLILLASAGIFLSAAPLANWFYLLWSVAIAVWLISRTHTGILRVSQIAVISLCLLAIAIELPYHVNPHVPQNECKVLYVIGDSVSAGIGGVKEHPWPQILGNEHNIKVINLAKAGATAASAIPQAKQVHDQNAVVLIEIGGNDLFAPTPPKEFKASLEQILSSVTIPARTVIMLELPLLPLQNEYGRIQRSLARKYDVILMPKRFLVDVLSSKGATVDLAHLSQEGHKLMAERVWSIISPSFELKGHSPSSN
jgi:acyl-CoA thioesterase-1